MMFEGKRLLDYAASFSSYMQSGTNLSPRTREVYSYELNLFARKMGNPLINDLSSQTLLQWNQMLYDAGAATATMDLKHNALRRFFDFMEQFAATEEAGNHAGRLLRSLKRLQTPKGRKSSRTPFSLNEEQGSKMIEAAGRRLGIGPRDRAIVHLFWAAGIRRAELRDLVLDDLDITERLATVTGKGSKTRNIVYDSACQEDLVNWLDVRLHWPVRPEEQHVFVSVKGGPLHLNYISDIIRNTAKEAGLRKDVWTHIFRHSSVTRMADRGENVFEVAAFHGHENINTTKGYYHPDVKRLKAMYDRGTTGKKRRQGRQIPVEAPDEDLDGDSS